MVKMMKFYVTNGVEKARVWYSRSTLIDGRDCVTIYAKDYTNALYRVFADQAPYENNTDIMTDYFETGRVRIFPGNPLWNAACARAAR
jgi:hypothetical protein